MLSHETDNKKYEHHIVKYIIQKGDTPVAHLAAWIMTAFLSSVFAGPHFSI